MSRETMELIACESLSSHEEVKAAHQRFMVEYITAMKRAGAEEFPLGMDMSIPLISSPILPAKRTDPKGLD